VRTRQQFANQFAVGLEDEAPCSPDDVRDVADKRRFPYRQKKISVSKPRILITNGLNILRIISGLFFFPHVMGKFAASTVSAATAGFFAKAGFHPPEIWVYVAAVSETAVAVALVLGICTRFAALGAVALLAIAVYSLQVVKGFGWTWNTGGYEYPAFWAIVSFSVAIEAWKGHLVRVSSSAVSDHLASWQRVPLVH
jgi:putative oxidoreductase